MDHGSSFGRRLPLIALVTAGAIFAVTLFRVPLGTLLFLGILLLCPLLMTRMHGGGHEHGETSRDTEDEPSRQAGDAGHQHGDPSCARWN